MNAHTILAKFDIIIIGAGIMGSSIAFQLSKQTNKSILIIDQFAPVGGMSGRTFGQIRLHYSNALMLKLAMRGYEVFSHWSDEVGYGNAGYIPMGYLLTVQESQLKALQQNIDLAQSLGGKAYFVDPDAIKTIEPALNTETLVGGVYDPAGGYIDSTRMALSWLTATQEQGAQLMTKVRVNAIETKNGIVSGISTSQGRIAASVVINATGPWGNELLSPLDIHLPLEARRLDMMYMRQPPNRSQIGCCITDGNSNVVIRPDMGRDILVAAYPPKLPLSKNPLECGNKNDEATHHQRIQTAFAKCLPDYQDAQPIRSVSGSYDITPDWHPIVGWAPNVGGLYLVVGFSGHGLKLAPAIGEVVTEAVLDKPQRFNINPLRFERFSEGEPMYLAYGPGARA